MFWQAAVRRTFVSIKPIKPIQVYLTLDRKAALKDADFVTTQFRVGLLDARAKDERIPLSHGVLGQETNGPGGLSLKAC
jgi:6-phospho-beta-glucosidase